MTAGQISLYAAVRMQFPKRDIRVSTHDDPARPVTYVTVAVRISDKGWPGGRLLHGRVVVGEYTMRNAVSLLGLLDHTARKLRKDIERKLADDTLGALL